MNFDLLPFGLSLVLSAFVSAADGASAPRGPAEPRAAVRAPVATESVLVLFEDRADLSAAAGIADRAARRRFVYEALRATADASQAPLVARLVREGVPHRAHYLVNAVEVAADESTVRSLVDASARTGARMRIVANRPSRLETPPPGAVLAPRRGAEGIEPNIALVGAPEVWARGFTGQGVVIGIADTGVKWDHPALVRQYRGSEGTTVSHAYNWHDAVHENVSLNACGHDSPAPCDDEGHGTAVAGLAVGDDGGDNRIGVAPGARWIGCRNMDIGNGTPARYVECFEFFLAPTDASGQNPRPELGADVVNSSWTCPEVEGCTDPEILHEAVRGLREAGIAAVFAAGNSGPSCSSLSAVPAIYDEAFTIGATDDADTVAIFSARGPVARDGSQRIKPDLMAPGVNVRSSTTGNSTDPYAPFGGTSGATPQVSGAIALLWSAAPGIAGDVDGVREVLQATAVPLASTACGGAGPPNAVYGWGRLDAAAALEVVPARAAPEPPAAGRPEARTLPARP